MNRNNFKLMIQILMEMQLNVFTSKKENISNNKLMQLDAWGYKVYAY